jgi:hypothetical protein
MPSARLTALALARVVLAGCASQSSKPRDLEAAEQRLNGRLERQGHGRETVEVVSKESLRRGIERYETLNNRSTRRIPGATFTILRAQSCGLAASRSSPSRPKATTTAAGDGRQQQQAYTLRAFRLMVYITSIIRRSVGRRRLAPPESEASSEARLGEPMGYVAATSSDGRVGSYRCRWARACGTLATMGGDHQRCGVGELGDLVRPLRSDALGSLPHPAGSRRLIPTPTNPRPIDYQRGMFEICAP